MRVVAGTARGRTIVVPPGLDVRPTTDRVREAIFNSLHSHGLVEGASFADLFAGSGALGIEALSRGAAHCTFADTAPRALAALRQNLAVLGLNHQAMVKAAPAESVAPTLGPIDVALCDPPYAYAGWGALLATLAGVSRAIVVESDRPVEFPEGFEMLKQKRYSGTVVSIGKRATTS
jgi:16S rRNA (guanine(966)-N(2))-methyltransferase RsmD